MSEGNGLFTSVWCEDGRPLEIMLIYHVSDFVVACYSCFFGIGQVGGLTSHVKARIERPAPRPIPSNTKQQTAYKDMTLIRDVPDQH